MMLKKVVVITAILMFILFMFSSCTFDLKTDISTSDENSKKTITLLHYFSGSLSGGIDELVTEFNQVQSDYYLNAIPIEHEAFKVSILKSLTEKNPPELYSYWAGARTIDIKEQLLPIDDIWEKNNFESLFAPSVINTACKIEDHYYLLPITQHYVTFFYNKEVFESNHLNPPENWEAFIEVCEVLKQNNITPIGLGAKNKWPAQFWFDYLLLRTAGDDYRTGLMNGTNHYTDTEVLNVFKTWQTLLKAGYFNADTLTKDWYESPLEGFSNNTVGMTLMGTWAISVLSNDFNMIPGEDFGYFNFPVMDPSIPITALGPIDGIIIPKDAVNTQGALQALKYLASKTSQTSMALGSGAFSPSLEVDSSIYSDFQSQMLADINLQSTWAFNYDLSTPPAVADLGLSLFVEFLEFPDHYAQLLEALDQNVQTQFSK